MTGFVKRLWASTELKDEITADKWTASQELRKQVRSEIEQEPAPAYGPLPAYDHDKPCPKCHFMAGTTEFLTGFHDACSIPEAPYNMTPFFVRYAPPTRSDIENEERFYRRARAVPEHFERACPNCKHLWAEAVDG